MSIALTRSGEAVSGYFVGMFSDARLAKVGALLFKRICERLSTCIKSLAGNRALEVAFGRFLNNPRVDLATISNEFAKETNQACQGVKHILCIQDTVQVTFPSQEVKKSNFGPTGDADTKGLFIHPGVIVNAENKDVLGISSIQSWCRSNNRNNTQKKDRPIEEKESIRWVDTALTAKNLITTAALITVIGDRESDIFEVFHRVPDEKTHVIVRASHDRVLMTGEKISERLNDAKSAGQYDINLPAITGIRKTRKATLDVKYCNISLYDKSKEVSIEINCVSAIEISPVPNGETPISWVLLTTHFVNSLDTAIQILVWYTWRWVIEQIFRTMKNKGLKIEDSQIEKPEKLMILSALSLAAAIKVMCLVEARDGNTNRKSSDIFTYNEIILLALIGDKMEGKTSKLKNPYEKNSLSWAAWVIARLGGWNGYACETPPGPITMLRGLKTFDNYYQGWLLSNDNVCIG